MDTENKFLEKVFNSYNEITKYFDVKVIMKANGKYTIELTKKSDGGGKSPSKIDFLIEQFMLFKEQEEKRWAEQDKRWAEQLKFNEFVLNLFKDHGWIK